MQVENQSSPSPEVSAPSPAPVEEMGPLAKAAMDMFQETGPSSDEAVSAEPAPVPESAEKTAVEVAAEQQAVEEPAPQEQQQEDKWSLLAKAEERSRSLASRVKEYERQMRELQEKAQLAELAQKDPVAFAQRTLTEKDFEKIADKLIAGEKLGGVPKEQSEIEALKQKLERLEQERAFETQQKLISDYRSQIKSVVEQSDGVAKYWPGVEDEILSYADSHYATHQEVLTPEEAASRISQALTESIRKVHAANPDLLPGLLGFKKQETLSKPIQQRAEPNTLTNKMSTSVDPDASDGELTEEQRIDLAIKAFEAARRGQQA